MNIHRLDFVAYEETLLAMVLFKPSTLNLLHADLFDVPGNRAVYEIMRTMLGRGEKITREAVQQEAGRLPVYAYVPEPWFTVGNINFYLNVLAERQRQKSRRAELLDELHVINEELGGIAG